MKALRLVTCLVPALWLAGCGDESETPESRLRATVSAAEEAVEARSLKRSAVYVSPHYRDRHGHDARAIRQLLFGYLQRHRDIHLFTRISDLRLAGDEKAADVRLYVAMSGVPVTSLEAAAELRADLYRFELHFIDSEEGWQVRQADWRRVEPGEIFD